MYVMYFYKLYYNAVVNVNPLQLDPPPEYIEYRQQLWDKLKKEYDEWVSAQAPQSIHVTLPDGKVVEAMSWRTTPYEIAKSIRLVDV